MIMQKVSFRIALPVGILTVLLVATVAFAAGRQETNSAAPTPQMVGVNTPPPVPPHLTSVQAQFKPAVLSTVLSYYFIPGNTFTPDLGSSAYARQVIGCVNQMPLAFPFSAPVHLPQGSQVVSITLYTYNSVPTTTISTAYFILNDGKGSGGSTVSADSRPNVVNYQQNNSTDNNPATIDNQNYNYLVQWRKTGVADSPLLSLCGVRVAYYAPVGATFLPLIAKSN